MKNAIISIIAVLTATACAAQSFWPDKPVTDMKGRTRNLSDFAPEKGVTLFVFWKTCCPNTLTMIDELKEVWSEYGDSRSPIKVVLVSMDDQRSASRVRPIVDSRGWEWDVIMDRNGDLARSYNIFIPPQWLAFDRTGKEVFRSKITNGSLDSEIYFAELIEKIHIND